MTGLTGLESGRRVERVEWGVRTLADNGRRVIEFSESEDDARWVVSARNESNLPYWRGREPEIVSRTVVTYTTNWKSPVCSPSSESA